MVSIWTEGASTRQEEKTPRGGQLVRVRSSGGDGVGDQHTRSVVSRGGKWRKGGGKRKEPVSQPPSPPVNQPVRQSSRRGSFSVTRSLTYSLATRCVN